MARVQEMSLEELNPRGRKREREMDLLSPFQAMEEIKRIKVEDLWAEGVRTELPYPGAGDPGGLPGRSISFIGWPGVKTVFDIWTEHRIITGPNGAGKSCLLRALACYIYQRNQGTQDKLVCIWSMEKARDNIVDALKQAFLFTYVEGSREDVEEIEAFALLDDVEMFMNTRGMNNFSFIIDGAQAWDTTTCTGKKRPGSAYWETSKPQLDKLFKKCKVLWGAEALSHRLVQQIDNPIIGVTTGLPEAMYEEFMSKSVLGHLRQYYQQDMDYYAGRHPLLLDTLDDCCHLHLQDIMPGYADMELDNVHLAELLMDKEDWEEVCNWFTIHRWVRSIWSYYSFQRVASECAWKLPCYDVNTMADNDPRYVYKTKKGKVSYCSEYIRLRYLEEFRKLEKAASWPWPLLGQAWEVGTCRMREELLINSSGENQGLHLGQGSYVASSTNGAPVLQAKPWLGYCRYLIAEGCSINRSEAGLLVQRLTEEVISRKGIRINGVLDMNVLHAQRFTEPGLEPGVVDLSGRVCGEYFSPGKCNYPHVDGVIVWKDSTGQKHLIALQFTTSLAQHLHSAPEFMNLTVVEEWIPDILNKSRSNEWKCHFVFVSLCHKRQPENVAEVIDTIQGVSIGTIRYQLHCILFQEAFQARVDESVLSCLNGIVAMREHRYVPPPPAGTSQKDIVKRLRREIVEEMAKNAGIADPSRNVFRNKDILIDELENLGKLGM